jgi:hypothetical protein
MVLGETPLYFPEGNRNATQRIAIVVGKASASNNQNAHLRRW